MSVAEGVFYLTLGTLIMWAPVFGFAYSRRRFGGSASGYLAAYFAVSFATIAVFVLMALMEGGSR